MSKSKIRACTVHVLFLLLLCARAWGVDVYYSNPDATNRTVIMTPLQLTPVQGRAALYDRVRGTTDGSGYYCRTNCPPGLWQVEVLSPPDSTKFAILVSTNAAALDMAAITVAMPKSVTRPEDYSYSASASDLRYAIAGGGGLSYMPQPAAPWLTNWSLVDPASMASIDYVGQMIAGQRISGDQLDSGTNSAAVLGVGALVTGDIVSTRPWGAVTNGTTGNAAGLGDPYYAFWQKHLWVVADDTPAPSVRVLPGDNLFADRMISSFSGNGNALSNLSAPTLQGLVPAASMDIRAGSGVSLDKTVNSITINAVGGAGTNTGMPLMVLSNLVLYTQGGTNYLAGTLDTNIVHLLIQGSLQSLQVPGSSITSAVPTVRWPLSAGAGITLADNGSNYIITAATFQTNYPYTVITNPPWVTPSQLSTQVSNEVAEIVAPVSPQTYFADGNGNSIVSNTVTGEKTVVDLHMNRYSTGGQTNLGTIAAAAFTDLNGNALGAGGTNVNNASAHHAGLKTIPMGFYPMITPTEAGWIGAAQYLNTNGYVAHGYEDLVVGAMSGQSPLSATRTASGKLQLNTTWFPNGVTNFVSVLRTNGCRFGLWFNFTASTNVLDEAGGQGVTPATAYMDGYTMGQWGVQHAWCGNPYQVSDPGGVALRNISETFHSGLYDGAASVGLPMPFTEISWSAVPHRWMPEVWNAIYLNPLGLGDPETLGAKESAAYFWADMLGHEWIYNDDCIFTWFGFLTRNACTPCTSWVTTDVVRFMFGLNCMNSMPLFLKLQGGASPETAEVPIIQNDAAIAINQDALRLPATVVTSNATYAVLSKPLANGDVAVALWNLNTNAATEISIALLSIPGVHTNSAEVLDVFEGATTNVSGMLFATVNACGMNLYRILTGQGSSLSTALLVPALNGTSVNQSLMSPFIVGGLCASSVVYQAVCPENPCTTNLSFWLKADAQPGLTSGTAANWVDSSGLGNDATNSTGLPVWHTNAVNSLPAFAFYGTNKLVSKFVGGASYDNITLIVVYNEAASGAHEELIGNSFTQGFDLYCRSQGDLDFYFQYLSDTSDPAPAAQWNVGGGWRSGTNTGSFCVSASNTATNNAHDAGLHTASALPPTIGARPDGSIPFTGQIAEILLYHDLSAQDRALAIAYAQSKYLQSWPQLMVPIGTSPVASEAYVQSFGGGGTSNGLTLASSGLATNLNIGGSAAKATIATNAPDGSPIASHAWVAGEYMPISGSTNAYTTNQTLITPYIIGGIVASSVVYAASVPVNPCTTNLSFWIKADAQTELNPSIANGVAADWLDSSGLGNDFTNNAAWPLFKTNAINSLPSFAFYGTNKLVGKFVGGAAYTNITLMVVYKVTTAGSHQELINNSWQNGFDFWSYTTGGVDFDCQQLENITGTTTSGQWYIAGGWQDGTNTGVWQGSSTNTTSNAGLHAGSNLPEVLGMRPDGSIPLTGEIAEVLLYHDLSVADRGLVYSSYLYRKYMTTDWPVVATPLAASPVASQAYVQSAALTNGLTLRTNYTDANFVPVSGSARFCMSNNVLYMITTAKTNLISDGR